MKLCCDCKYALEPCSIESMPGFEDLKVLCVRPHIYTGYPLNDTCANQRERTVYPYCTPYGNYFEPTGDK